MSALSIARQPEDPSGSVTVTATGLLFTLARLILIASTRREYEPQVTGIRRSVRNTASAVAFSAVKPSNAAKFRVQGDGKKGNRSRRFPQVREWARLKAARLWGHCSHGLARRRNFESAWPLLLSGVWTCHSCGCSNVSSFCTTLRLAAKAAMLYASPA